MLCSDTPTSISSTNKNIDMSTIEMLKQRRNMSREKGDCLATRRDETIKKIQKEMNLGEHSRTGSTKY